MLNQQVLRPLAVLALAAALAGCGVSPNPTAKTPTATQAAALKKKTDDAARQTPPVTAKPGEQPKQGFAAREAARISDRALTRYTGLTYDWDHAYSDYEKDRIEQQMLDVLHQGMTDVQRETSANGHDAADRRAYDIADAGLDRYDRLYRQWQLAWGDREKRRIVNDMLVGMVRTHQDVKSNY